MEAIKVAEFDATVLLGGAQGEEPEERAMSYKVEAIFQGPKLDTGMVKYEEQVGKELSRMASDFHDAELNKADPYFSDTPPTGANICLFFAKALKASFPGALKSLRVWSGERDTGYLTGHTWHEGEVIVP
jgi:6-pyruvoyl-tetrahydropterin synthase